MKRYIFAAIAVLMILSLCILGAGASDEASGTDGGFDSEIVSESVFEGQEATAEEGSVSDSEEAVSDMAIGEESAQDSEPLSEEAIAGIDAEELNDVISNSQSKTEAIINIADIFGISVSDAEALVNTLVAFGDEHFEESDTWLVIRNNIIEHPDLWTVIAIAAMGFIALVAFLIRCIIRNALTQTNTKLKLKDIDEHEQAVDGKLELVDTDNKEIISLLGGIKELLEGESAELKRENEDLKALLELIREAIASESAAVDSLKANSETSLKVTEESSLQILQLLNIAMNRKVPTVSEGARKVWYEDAVAKVKAKAGISEGTEKSE